MSFTSERVVRTKLDIYGFFYTDYKYSCKDVLVFILTTCTCILNTTQGTIISTSRHYITEILLKVALNTITPYIHIFFMTGKVIHILHKKILI